MMMILWSTIIATLVGLASAAAIPRDSGFKMLSAGQLQSTDTYANYAAASTCPGNTLPYWNCGGNCNAIRTFQLSSFGGDGQNIPQYFTGYDSALDSIMVVHQDFDAQNPFSSLINAGGTLMPLNATGIFGNITSNIQVYNLYAQLQLQTIQNVSTSVMNLLGTYPQAMVTTIGFSGAGAVALLDALYLRMQVVPATTEIRTVSYGMSRPGNGPFADLVDSVLPGSVKRICNKMDPYPVVPALSTGYSSPDGEIHIQKNGKWITCYGHDNGDNRCIAGAVTSINDANFQDHSGPYDGVMISCLG